MDLRACDLGYQRQSTLIYQYMVFAAELAAISRVSASMLATGRCRYAGCVNAGSIRHDLVILSELPQHRLVDALPHTCLHPFVKATPARHAAPAPELTRQVLPRYSGSEEKQGSRQGCTHR
ncbi:hypothetical protein OTB17_01610 [Massilia sp. H27-R4]|nr:hypothetical protein [Massilia sp. H27-R4]MCY0910394.1 hypothetical protein [Massilia sp. H27-R4]